jgi:hypothetical protein
MFLAGLGCLSALVVSYFRHDRRVPPPESALDHLAITGLLFMIIGFSTFCFTLVLHATEVRYGNRDQHL